MQLFTLFFIILGVSYATWWFMKFILWLDGGDHVDTDDSTFDLDSESKMDKHIIQHRNAA